VTTEHRGAPHTYTRTTTLRPISHELKGQTDARPLRLTSAVAGRASELARTATLATLGVQRLAGIRQTGLAMWLGQTCIDQLAARRARRAADVGARRSLSLLAKTSPGIAPPRGVLERAPEFRDRIRCGVVHTWIDLTAQMDNLTETSGTAMTSVEVSARLNRSKRWMLGIAVDLLELDVSTGGPDSSWTIANFGGRVAYKGKHFSIGTTLSLALLDYHFISPFATSDAVLRSLGASYDVELMFGNELGIGARGYYTGDGELTIQHFQPFVGWHVRPQVRLEFRYSQLDFHDYAAVGGTVGVEGEGGLGAAIIVEW
jgi:hypothetical protein